MKSKIIISMLFSLLVSIFAGVGISAAFGLPEIAMPVTGTLFVVSLIPMPHMAGLSMATVYREVWTKEMIKALTTGLKDTFLDGMRDLSQYVTGSDEAQVIHLSYFGVEPDVLINNTTYPIPTQTLDGSDIPISLDKYQTKATPITDDELYALAYDKMKAVNEAHKNAIIRNRLQKSIHAFGPASSAAKTPVILTTGAVTPDGTRKRMTWQDVISLREAYAAAGIPMENMRLVLCEDHVNDLLLADTSFNKAYTNFKGGMIINQLGFDIREFSNNPYYTVGTKAKLSFGAIPNTTTDRKASICFPVSNGRKASGIMKMYYSESKTDTANQQSLINYRNYFIAMPAANEGIGAIVSDLGA